MTGLGKTLTVFVFLLSLVWSWLTMNAFVTRANYKAQATALKASLDSMTQRNSQLEQNHKEMVAAIAASETSQKAKLEEKDKKIATLEESNTRLTTAAGTKTDLQKKSEDGKFSQSQILQATLAELEIARKSRDTIEARLITALRSEEASKNAALASKLESEAVKYRLEVLEQYVVQIQQERQNMGRGLGAVAFIPVPEGIRASVSAVNSDLITINLGLDAGIRKGAVLDVSRLNPTKYLGQIQITQSDPKQAIGIFKPSNGRLNSDNLPIVGDNVSVIR